MTKQVNTPIAFEHNFSVEELALKASSGDYDVIFTLSYYAKSFSAYQYLPKHLAAQRYGYFFIEQRFWNCFNVNSTTITEIKKAGETPAFKILFIKLDSKVSESFIGFSHTMCIFFLFVRCAFTLACCYYFVS